MKYTCEIEIEKPIGTVIALFDNPDMLSQWMEGLVSFEHLSGVAGAVGAKSKLVFQMGKRRVEMIETITARNLPEEFSGTYDVKGAHNLVKNKFVALGENKTKYINEQEFRFNGFMKIVGFLMSAAFKKQSMKYLTNFKKFVENHA